jgi:type II secretory pathway component GspD/PulD (secretin)
MTQIQRHVEVSKILATRKADVFSVEFCETSICDAFHAISQINNIRYTFSSNIQGSVYLKIREIALDELIEILCTQCANNLTISKSGVISKVNPRSIEYIDKAHLQEAIELAKRVKTKTSIMSLPAKIALHTEWRAHDMSLEDARVSVDIQNAPLRDVLASFTDAFGFDFVLLENVQGLTSIAFENETFHDGLRRLMRTAIIPVTYSKTGNRFTFRPRSI